MKRQTAPPLSCAVTAAIFAACHVFMPPTTAPQTKSSTQYWFPVREGGPTGVLRALCGPQHRDFAGGRPPCFSGHQGGSPPLCRLHLAISRDGQGPLELRRTAPTPSVGSSVVKPPPRGPTSRPGSRGRNTNPPTRTAGVRIPPGRSRRVPRLRSVREEHYALRVPSKSAFSPKAVRSSNSSRPACLLA
ncbi:hypothetical protein NDU88_005999 [Pleurodeles waltl]|uniref:Secreted protein n=1 Tax=Pleurodeles waltl TaxID=8319 RepID=A0AAV7W9J5_PLEWA|nr:hypothetical protein NDU88_005999 [Pleurodeles waltl]